MREALAVVTGQGLESMWLQHRACHEQLWAGLSELGLEPYVRCSATLLPHFFLQFSNCLQFRRFCLRNSLQFRCIISSFCSQHLWLPIVAVSDSSCCVDMRFVSTTS